MKRKKPTIKELSQKVLENRHGIEISFKVTEELKKYISGLDRLLEWYIEFKGDVDGFKKYIEENKSPRRSSGSDGAEESIPDKQQNVPKPEPRKGVSEKSD